MKGHSLWHSKGSLGTIQQRRVFVGVNVTAENGSVALRRDTSILHCIVPVSFLYRSCIFTRPVERYRNDTGTIQELYSG